MSTAVVFIQAKKWELRTYLTPWDGQAGRGSVVQWGIVHSFKVIFPSHFSGVLWGGGGVPRHWRPNVEWDLGLVLGLGPEVQERSGLRRKTSLGNCVVCGLK